MRVYGVIILPSGEVMLGQRVGSDGDGTSPSSLCICVFNTPADRPSDPPSHVASLLTPSSRATSDVIIRRVPNIRDVSVLAVVLDPSAQRMLFLADRYRIRYGLAPEINVHSFIHSLQRFTCNSKAGTTSLANTRKLK